MMKWNNVFVFLSLLLLLGSTFISVPSKTSCATNGFVQNDQVTCGCNNPTTTWDECNGEIGAPGDSCGTDKFVQSDKKTCGCDDPTTTASNECILGNPGDVCPTDPDQFVQSDQVSCGCNNPDTSWNECNGEIGQPGDSCGGSNFVQADKKTCGCDNPDTSSTNECIPAGSCTNGTASLEEFSCTNPVSFKVQCACDAGYTLTGATSLCGKSYGGTCVKNLSCEAQCFQQYGDDTTAPYRTCERACWGCTSIGSGLYKCTDVSGTGSGCVDGSNQSVPCPATYPTGCFPSATGEMACRCPPAGNTCCYDAVYDEPTNSFIKSGPQRPCY